MMVKNTKDIDEPTQMHKLLDVPERTLRDWKNGNRDKLYQLLETLDYETAQKLLAMHNNADLKRVLENEAYYNSLRAFEKDSLVLFSALVKKHQISYLWLKQVLAERYF